MNEPRFHVLAIGNAIVDVIASAEEDFLIGQGMVKGSMSLLDTPAAEQLYAHMGPARETSGGSAANTVAGIAAIGGRAAFVGQVSDDQLGAVFRHDILAQGVAFTTASLPGETPTGRCLITVTPDGQRTMRTSLGAAQFLPEDSLDPQQIEDAAILYLEGYMWGPPEPKAAMLRAMSIARQAGRRIAFTLSDAFCIDRHREAFRNLVGSGEVDILLANEAEIKCLQDTDDLAEAVAETSSTVPILVVTRSDKGAVCISGGMRYSVPAAPADRVIDTTGAGDLFAAGFLFGCAEGRPIPQCLAMGAVCAAEVISHFGARPEADLKRLIEAADIQCDGPIQLELPGLDLGALA